MIIGVPKEKAGERRVALVPDLVPKFKQAGLEIYVEAGAGQAAGFPDQLFADKGARVEEQLPASADIILKVQPPSAAEMNHYKDGALLIGFLQPYAPEVAVSG